MVIIIVVMILSSLVSVSIVIVDFEGSGWEHSGASFRSELGPLYWRVSGSSELGLKA